MEYSPISPLFPDSDDEAVANLHSKNDDDDDDDDVNDDEDEDDDEDDDDEEEEDFKTPSKTGKRKPRPTGSGGSTGSDAKFKATTLIGDGVPLFPGSGILSYEGISF